MDNLFKSMNKLKQTVVKDPKVNAQLVDLMEINKQIQAVAERVRSGELSFAQYDGLTSELKKQKQELIEAIPSLKITDFSFNPSKNYTDSELIKIASDFLNLGPEERKQLYLGSGVFKDAFEIPGTNLVLKTRKEDGMGGNDEALKDYFSNKDTEDLFPEGASEKYSEVAKNDPNWKTKFLERPKLVVIPGEEPILIQKKLITQKDLDTLQGRVEDFRNRNITREYEDILHESLEPKYRPDDIHSGNVGIDPDTKEIKAFDAMGSHKSMVSGRAKRFKDFINNVYKSIDPKVYRAVVPLVSAAKPFATIAGKVGFPLMGMYGSYQEAKEAGLPTALAMAYATAEEGNPIPISGIDFYKGMEKAAEGRRKNLESMYMPKEMKAKQEFLENYAKSDMAKDKAYGTLRKILKNDVDEELVKKLLPKRVVTPFKPED